MLNVAICGPDPDLNQYLDELVCRFVHDEQVRVASFEKTGAFIGYMDTRGNDVNIILTGVALDGFNGIKLMKVIQERLPDIQIVFVSRYKELVFDAYAVRHVAFIPLPVDTAQMRIAIEMAQENIRLRHKPYLTLARGGLISRIDLDDIVYLESDSRTLCVNTVHGVSQFPRQLESVKPELDSRFVHCHKSYIVNMDCIAALDTAQMSFVLKNGLCVPVSERKLKETKEIFQNYLERY